MTADNYHDENGVLFNYLGIKMSKELRDLEYIIVRNSGYNLFDELVRKQTFEMSFNGLCYIHEKLFSDIYPWAGKPRRTPLFKGESSFAPPDKVNAEWFNSLMRQFRRASENGELGFNKLLGELWGRINWQHPFPEGNGRATQFYVYFVAKHYGYIIDWSATERGEELEAARSSLSNSFSGYSSILTKCLKPSNPLEPASTSLWIER